MSHPTLAQLDTAAVDCLKKLEPGLAALKVKERLAIPPQEMPSQDPDVRRHNIQEVALGYTAAQAKAEALRCLQCKNKPCIAGCPVAIDIPAFIQAIADGDFQQAIDIIKKDSLLPAVCGRVCPQ